MSLGMWMPGTQEMIIILIVGLILFGGRLPEVGKSLGRSVIEFRKGLRGLKDEVGLNELDDIKRDLQNAARSAMNDVNEATDSYRHVIPEDKPEPQDAEFHATTAPDAPTEAAPPTETGEDPAAPRPVSDEPPPTGDGDSPPAFGYQR